MVTIKDPVVTQIDETLTFTETIEIVKPTISLSNETIDIIETKVVEITKPIFANITSNNTTTTVTTTIIEKHHPTVIGDLNYSSSSLPSYTISNKTVEIISPQQTA